MTFSPFIVRSEDKEKVVVDFSEMTEGDAQSTLGNSKGQSDWTTDNLDGCDRYALKTEDDELVALAAYEIIRSVVHVHIAYIESHPESNPTMTQHRKYLGIGRVLIAFGIKLSVDCGFHGDVTFEAKTPELERYYVKEYKAIRVSSYGSIAPRYTLSRESAKKIFMTYLV